MGKCQRKMLSLCIAAALMMTQVISQPVEIQAAAKVTGITLNKKSESMYVGQKITLKVAKVKPAKASKGVAWKSSNNKVATVSTKGKVTAKKAGTVKITAVSKNNAKVKAVCKIKVYKKASAIQLNEKEKTLHINESFQLKVTKTTPAKAYSQVSYKSSNKKIAAVNAKGKVTAKAVGKTTITVQNDSNKKAKAVCEIVVVPKAAAPTNTPTAALIPSEEPIPTGSDVLVTITPAPTSKAEDAGQAILYSGSYEQTSWTINGAGHLEVNGTGDMWENGSKPEWLQYSDKILSAEINVSDAKNASGMFAGCERVKTITLSNFDTSKITNMGYMFYGCDSLQEIECEEFITSEVTNMRYMFCGCGSLNEVPTKSFQTEKVTGMNDMFRGCEKLTTLDLGSFNTEQITNMSGMFRDCGSLQKIDIGSFDTSKVTNMTNMFAGCSSLTKLDMQNFNTTNVKNMSGMFRGCDNLTEVNMSSFVTGNVTNMSEMFYGCESLKALELTSFQTENVTNMNDMFRDCSGLTELDLHSFDISNVTSYTSTMVYGCRSLRVIKTPYKSGTQKCNLVGIWKDIEGKQYNILPQNAAASIVLNWIQPTATPTLTATPTPIATPTPKPTATPTPTATPSPKPTATPTPTATTVPEATPSPTAAPTSTPVPTKIISPETPEENKVLYSGSYGQTTWKIDTNGKLTVEGTGNMWAPNGKPQWREYKQHILSAEINVSGATNARSMFFMCSKINSIDLSKFSSEDITDMYMMFYGCENLQSIEFGNFRTDSVTDMQWMFANCGLIEKLDLSGFDTSNVTNMTSMFQSCQRLTELNLSSFDTSKVTTMLSMFAGCSGLKEVDLSSFDVSNVVCMDFMFSGCKQLRELDLKNFNTEKLQAVGSMFEDCESLEQLNISNFNTSRISRFRDMFRGCRSLTVLDLSNFEMKDLSFEETKVDDNGFYEMDRTGMFTDCEKLTTIYTPKTTGTELGTLEGTWKDETGQKYIALPQNATKSIKLVKISDIQGTTE